MKHVREELPDIQQRRPEVSSALAAVIDRATAKDLDRRYVDDAELIADLEDVLAIETARAGQATGEATAILRTLPAAVAPAAAAAHRVNPTHRARARRCCSRPRPPRSCCSPPTAPSAAPGTTPGAAAAAGHRARLARAATPRHDYDPFGGDGEHPERSTPALDRDPNTAWSTESYQGGLSKPGVGIYVDAKPRRRRRAAWTSARRRRAGRARSTSPRTRSRRRCRAAGATSATSTPTAARRRVDLDTAGQRLPLLPRLDHGAAARTRSGRRSPRSTSSAARALAHKFWAPRERSGGMLRAALAACSPLPSSPCPPPPPRPRTRPLRAGAGVGRHHAADVGTPMFAYTARSMVFGPGPGHRHRARAADGRRPRHRAVRQDVPARAWASTPASSRARSSSSAAASATRSSRPTSAGCPTR